MRVPSTLENKKYVVPKTLELERLERRRERGSLYHRTARVMGGFALSATALAGIDTITGAAMWHNDTPTITTIEGQSVQQASDKVLTDGRSDAMLVFGGFGVSNSRAKQIGMKIEEALPDLEKVAVINYADKGIDIDKIVETTEEYLEANDIHTIDIYGHSMGGMIGMEVAAELKEKDNIAVRSIILDCTPANKRNVRGSDRGGTTLLKQTDELGLHFGPVTRVGMQATRILTKNPKAIFNSDTFPKALRQASNSASNGVMQDQAGIVDTFNVADYKDTFPASSTDIIQIHPYNNDADHTIDDSQAYNDWQTGLVRPISRIALRGSGHASILSDTALYSKALHKVYASSSDTKSYNVTIQTPPNVESTYIASHR
ncbi:MAG TPA: alpha/beta hydrolase [Candidatus Saccharimonadales bacterium]|nr:alpha/beta hydrolase [Candidatus Saccharimonadales bacterium]